MDCISHIRSTSRYTAGFDATAQTSACIVGGEVGEPAEHLLLVEELEIIGLPVLGPVRDLDEVEVEGK